jgi:hypothetical protein
MKNAQYVQIAALAILILGSALFIINQTSKPQFALQPQTQVAQASPSGPVAYYAFNEGSGTVTASSIGSTNGTLTNGTTWAAGKFGQGLNFDGVNDRLVTPNNPIGSGAGTYSAWIFARSFGGFGAGAVIDNGGARLRVTSSGSKFAFSSNNFAATASSANNSVILNQWIHIAVTRDASGTANLYVNGVLSGTANQTSGTPTPGNNVEIGNNLTGVVGFDGIIDEVRIYNEVLTQAQITELYNLEGSTSSPQPPVENPPPQQGQYTLSVTTSGSGTVTGTGISCGSDCSEALNSGTSVTLSASAASGSTFTGWSGGCSGTGTCSITLNANTTVTATFNTQTQTTGPKTYNVKQDGTGDFNTIQACANVAVAGSTCLVYPGTYAEFVFTKNNGTGESSRVMFKAEGSVTAQGFFIMNTYNTIDGFNLTGSTQYSAVVHVEPTGSYCHILNNTIRDSSKFGVNTVINASGAGATNCIIRGNTFSNLQANFVSMTGGGYHLVENNIFELWNSQDYIRLTTSNTTIRRNIFRRGNMASEGHADVVQIFGHELYPVIENNVFEENWVEGLEGQTAMLSNNHGTKVGIIYPTIRNLIFRRNVFANITQNLIIVMPGVTIENNTFYRNAYTLGGITISGTLDVGNAPNTTIKNNVFLAGGSSPTAINDQRGFYNHSGASFTAQTATIHVANNDATIGNAIYANLQKNGYIQGGSNGTLLAKALALTDISQFVFDAPGYESYKQATYDVFIKVVKLYHDSMNTFFADYNFVAGAAPTFPGKLKDQCTTPGIYYIFNFCEAHGINGGDPQLKNLASLLGPDGVPFTLDDGLKPQSSSPLCGKGTNGMDIGTYSCDPTKVFATGNSDTGGIVITPPPTVFEPTPDPSLPCEIGTKTTRAVPIDDGSSIRLTWPKNDFRQELKISRRVYSPNPNSWGNWTQIHAVTDPTQARQASEFRDTNVVSGTHYEYQIAQLVSAWSCSGTPALGIWSHFWSYQYINTGNAVPLKDQRGKIVLLVESGIAASLATELTRLQNDLIGDGYKVYRHDVAAADVGTSNWSSSVAATKALVRADYNSDPGAEWTVFIVGHVPIPYSGLSSPGSHTENYGAHPADWYYADMTESGWTDTTVNNTTADYAHNRNVPGDGKFDQSQLPSAPEMRVGRIDLRNMPAFGKTEVQLLRQYLDREHAWRHKQFTARDRALVNSNNNLGLIYTGRPFESHNVYASYFGTTQNTDLGAWLTAASTPSTSYLFSASNGNGQFTRDMQIGTTANFASTPLYVVFPSMYGSYYGNWDSAMHPDIVIQAPLAANGYAVANYYRENVMNLDSSSMGEPIGQELFTLASSYFTGSSKFYLSYGWIYNGQTNQLGTRVNNYVSLLGDPTLKTRIVAPPTNVLISTQGGDNFINWNSVSDTNIQGYHIYRAPLNDLNSFVRITNSPVIGSYRDVGAASGSYRYMVRTIKLENSQNRSYYNASVGIFALPSVFIEIAGDFNKDGFVNSVDFSYMNSKWNSNDVTADLNKDGSVNTLDYAIMVKNWTPLGF